MLRGEHWLQNFYQWSTYLHNRERPLLTSHVFGFFLTYLHPILSHLEKSCPFYNVPLYFSFGCSNSNYSNFCAGQAFSLYFDWTKSWIWQTLEQVMDIFWIWHINFVQKNLNFMQRFKSAILAMFHSAKIWYNFRSFVISSGKKIGRPILANLPPYYVPFSSHHAWPT